MKHEQIVYSMEHFFKFYFLHCYFILFLLLLVKSNSKIA